MSGNNAAELLTTARTILNEKWLRIGDLPMPSLPRAILESIDRSINSKTITYRYVLPTQVLAKCANPLLDSRSVQAGSGLAGAFDARSICHKLVVPFDRENHSVLGGSSEPYLNNPLRIAAIQEESRQSQKDKNGFDNLRKVLEFVESEPARAMSVCEAVLIAIHARMQVVGIVYSVPNRIGLANCTETLKKFLEVKTGGLRLQVVATALFRALGERVGYFSNVVANHINAADIGTGNVADLECQDADGRCILAVEIKDRELTLRQIQDKLPGIRERGIRELLFLVRDNTPIDESTYSLIEKEFTSGQNLYVTSFDAFLETCAILLGEQGRRNFFLLVGKELDRQRADFIHRKRWKDLLEEI